MTKNQTVTTDSKSLLEMIDEFVEFLPEIRSRKPADFDGQFHRKLHDLSIASANQFDERNRFIRYCFERCSEELDQSLVHRHARHKPFGYAGDYQVIDYIYTCKSDSPGDGQLWDEFFHRQHAPRAVRNRMAYFCSLFGPLFERKGEITVLDIASGPCRDLLQIADTWKEQVCRATFHCVEIDVDAIKYAEQLLAGSALGNKVVFEQANALKCRPQGSFDLVWSSGLFDYLEDRLAVFLLKRMWKWTRDDGYLIVGNFHTNHKSRNYIEWCGDWFLIHRDEDDYRRLCHDAGIPEANISFETEPLGACLFLKARKG